MLAAMALATLDTFLSQPMLLLGLGYQLVGIHLTTAGLLLCAYASGAVILFGGLRAWRRARFGLLLLLLVNPVPGIFTSFVDLPLQAIGAHIARGFAALIGVPVSSGTLTMMFAPNLGIFIAAGCDGMRGAVSMGLLALVIGHLRRLRPTAHTLFVLAAMVIAYIFNLLRLCAVIGYYWFALRIPVLGNYGTGIDYLIGGLLFVCAAGFLFAAPRWRQTA
jgi:exosortase J